MMARDKHLILFLAANPRGTAPLALAEEADAIRDELDRGPIRSQLEFRPMYAATPLDLLRALRELRPTVVHFAGHGAHPARAEDPVSPAGHRDVCAGDPGEGLYLQGADGGAQFVSTAVLRRTFGAAGSSVKLVVLNACYSEPVARALLQHIESVVGMKGAISDEAARAFAIEFYRRLRRRGTIVSAVQDGKLAMEMRGLPGRELPQLRVRRGVDRDELVLARDQLARRAIRAAGSDLRLGFHLCGPAVAAAMILATGAAAYRAWFAFGEPSLEVRAQWLAVDAASAPEPIQGNDGVRAIFAPNATVERQARPTVGAEVPRRIALTGAFDAIELGRDHDAPCRWIFDARATGLGVARVTPDDRGCAQSVALRAGARGLELGIDDEPPIPVAPFEHLVLHVPPGKPLTLAPRTDQLVVFRPANDVVWSVEGLRGAAGPGERVHLPGGVRDSDIFELKGRVELRQLLFDRGRLEVVGVLRDWRGTVGRRGDWNSAAPWPPSRSCWLAFAIGLGLVVGVFVRARRRLRRWGQEAG